MIKNRIRIIRSRATPEEIQEMLENLRLHLTRIQALTNSETNSDADEHIILHLIRESQYLIEWTVPTLDLEKDESLNIATELIRLQRQLSQWKLQWHELWADSRSREAIAKTAQQWCQSIDQWSVRSSRVRNQFRFSGLKAIADQNERCPVVGMAEVAFNLWGFSVGSGDNNAGSGAADLGIVVFDQGNLGLAEGFGFGQAEVEGNVEGVHEFLGAAVIDLPEGGNGGFGPGALELVAQAEDFLAIAKLTAEAGFAGGEDNEINAVEVPGFDVT